MTAPPPPRPPEPLMTIWVAAKPGAKPRETLVDEATAEQLQRELTVALEGIRAAKQAVAAMLAPRPADDDDDVVDDTIFCSERYRDAAGYLQECAEPAGHDGPHGDPVMTGQREMPSPDRLTGGDVLLASLAADDDDGEDPTVDPSWPGDPAPDADEADGGCLEVSPSGSACVKGAGHDVVNGTPHEDMHGLRWDDGGILAPRPHGGGRYQQMAQDAIDAADGLPLRNGSTLAATTERLREQGAISAGPVTS